MKQALLLLFFFISIAVTAPLGVDTAAKPALTEKQILRKLGPYGNKNIARAILESEDPQQKLSAVASCLRTVAKIGVEADEFSGLWSKLMSTAAANATSKSSKESFSAMAKNSASLALWHKSLKEKPEVAIRIVKYPQVVAQIAKGSSMNFFQNIRTLMQDESVQRVCDVHADTVALIMAVGSRGITDMLAALRDPVLALTFSDNTPAITRAVLGAGVYAEIGFYALKQPNILNLAVTAGDSVALCYAPVAAALVKYKYIYCAPTAFSVLENKDLKIETIGDLQNWSKLIVKILKSCTPAEAARIFSALEHSSGLYTELQRNPQRTLAALKEFERYRFEAAVSDDKARHGELELYPVTDFFYDSFSDSGCMASFLDYCRKKKKFQAMMDDFAKQAFILQRKASGRWVEVGSSMIPVKD